MNLQSVRLPRVEVGPIASKAIILTIRLQAQPKTIIFMDFGLIGPTAPVFFLYGTNETRPQKWFQ